MRNLGRSSRLARFLVAKWEARVNEECKKQEKSRESNAPQKGSEKRGGSGRALNLPVVEKRNAGKDGKQLNGVKTSPSGARR